MAKPAFLEAFEVIDGGLADQPSDDWIAGHAAGLIEGIAKARSDQAALSDELLQSISDMSFGYHEARGHMMRALEPLFGSLISTFVPRFAQEMLSHAIAAALFETAKEAIDAPITIRVAVDQHALVGALLARVTDLPFVLHADPGLTSGQAIITGTASEHILDADNLIAQSRAILASLFDANQQRSDHG